MELFKDNYRLSEIWIYPVKSLSGFKVNEAFAENTGLQHDRRWLIVDEDNRFLTQRKLPEMALIQLKINWNNGELESLEFSHKTNENISYTLYQPNNENEDSKKISVQIWDDYVEAIELKDEINNWLSNILGLKCRLVYMPDSTKRKVDANYAISGNEITSFSDGYPYLIAGNAALGLLNSKLENPISINRFRPNFVFDGGEPHDEDYWMKFQIGEVEFFGVKKCARCPIPTINQETSLKGSEPLKTLSTYRFSNNKVYFGQNLLIGNQGIIKVGDIIQVLSKND